MELRSRLLLHCCLELLSALSLVEACRIFPNHTCCSSSFALSQNINQHYIIKFDNSMAAANATKKSLPKSLRILCFGDSLTAGYTMYGMEHHPYADHLRVGLEHMLASSNIQAEVAGFSGDQVQGSYLNRIKAKCPVTKTRRYDWVIIMGGTNDLAWGQQPEQIYEGLSRFPASRHKSPLPFNSRRFVVAQSML